MKYTDPELIEHLASEYVLGTMVGKARQRFERLQMESYRIRRTVWEWEQRLYPMGEGVESVTPPALLWDKIRRQTQLLDEKQPSGFWQSLVLWRSWGALTTFATVALMMLAFNTGQFSKVIEPESYMAVFNNSDAEPLWIISSDLSTGELSIRAVNAAAKITNKEFELWMLPADNTSPRSLGLMPVLGAKQQYTIAPEMADVLRRAKGLAVSIEPIGGSPTGLPTGDVLYQAAMIEL